MLVLAYVYSEFCVWGFGFQFCVLFIDGLISFVVMICVGMIWVFLLRLVWVCSRVGFTLLFDWLLFPCCCLCMC